MLKVTTQSNIVCTSGSLFYSLYILCFIYLFSGIVCVILAAGLIQLNDEILRVIGIKLGFITKIDELDLSIHGEELSLSNIFDNSMHSAHSDLDSSMHDDSMHSDGSGTNDVKYGGVSSLFGPKRPSIESRITGE